MNVLVIILSWQAPAHELKHVIGDGSHQSVCKALGNDDKLKPVTTATGHNFKCPS